MINLNEAINLVIETLKESVDDDTEIQRREQISVANSETKLFGSEGILDSIDIVTLLADLEEKLDTQYDITASLADDSIMSKAKSPFRSVKSLSKYIVDAMSH